MTIWFLIVVEWVLFMAAVALAEYALRRRVRS